MSEETARRPSESKNRDQGGSSGEILSNFFISLDGVVESADQWRSPWFNDEMGAVVGAGMDTNNAFLMGRMVSCRWGGAHP